MAGEVSIQNGKKGGRPLGKKSQKTLEKEAVLRALKERIMQNADKILGYQIGLAKGSQYLYKRKEHKSGYVENILVTDPNEMQSALDSIDNNENGKEGRDFYFLTAKDPDNRAIESMFNRTFGKPVESIEHTGKDGKDLIINIIRHGDKPAV